MIALARVITTEAIHDNFRDDKRVSYNKELLLQERQLVEGTLVKRDFNSSRWGAAKKQLFIESKGKCSYCEANTKVVAHGDVEHFRPKSLYWWLSYCYFNYLVSCAICNEINKKEKFPTKNCSLVGERVTIETSDADIERLAITLTPDPLTEENGLLYETFWDEIQSENPLLINPYYEDPELFFAYEVDHILREVAIISLRDEYKERVEASIDVYGLNRIELLGLRYKVFMTYDTHRLTLEENSLSPVVRQRNEDEIKKMIEPEALFAGMIRYFHTKNR